MQRKHAIAVAATMQQTKADAAIKRNSSSSSGCNKAPMQPAKQTTRAQKQIQLNQTQ
jgi:hypothetical protein